MYLKQEVKIVAWVVSDGGLTAEVVIYCPLKHAGCQGEIQVPPLSLGKFSSVELGATFLLFERPLLPGDSTNLPYSFCPNCGMVVVLVPSFISTLKEEALGKAHEFIRVNFQQGEK